MTDSDFTIGFKQGQEHGIQIMQEKIEEVKADIEKAMGEYYYSEHDLGVRQGFRFALEIIDNHIFGISEQVDKHIGEVRE